jgi:chromosome partitioning protein
MATIITIANEKGGVGKTTTAVNLAAGLALRLAESDGANGRVLLIDMDPQGHALLSTAYGHHSETTNQSLPALLTETPPPSIQKIIKRSSNHPNLYILPSNRSGMVEASRILPTLMANESRLNRALEPIANAFNYIVIDTPPTSGDLLVNALVAATHVLIPIETSYLGVSGLMELQKTIEQVRTIFQPTLKIIGYLPTLCEEKRAETQEILAELKTRYAEKLLEPIHKSSDLAYAHSSHMDIFSYRPPRKLTSDNIVSSSKATQEYANLVDYILKLT